MKFKVGDKVYWKSDPNLHEIREVSKNPNTDTPYRISLTWVKEEDLVPANPVPTPPMKYAVGDRVYLATLHARVYTIEQISPGAPRPYHLGTGRWVSEQDLDPAPPASEPRYKVGDTVFLPCKVVSIDEPYTLAPMGLDPKDEENYDFFVPREAVERS